MANADHNGRGAHWDRAWGEKPIDRMSWYQPEPEVSLRLIDATGTGRNARILDVGGGASLLVDRLLGRGHTHVGVLDASRVALDLARRRLGARADRVEWIEADVTSFESPHPWDVWHDRAVFHFLTEAAERDAYRRALLDAVEPGGHAIVATFAPTGPEQCSGLPTCRYSAADLAAQLGRELALVESVEETHQTPAGGTQDFIYARFVRSESTAS